MMSTQTQAAAPDAGEPTAVVADDKATALVGLAWSAAEDYPDDAETVDDMDRTTFWLRLSVATAAAVVVVLGVVLAYVLSQRTEPEPAAAPAVPAPSAPDVVVPSSPAPEPSPSVEPAPPPVIIAPPPVTTEVPPPPRTTTPENPNADSAFLNSLDRAGITINDVPTAIRGGQAVCTFIEQGHTARQAAQESRRNAPSLSLAEAGIYVASAVEFFCPQAGR